MSFSAHETFYMILGLATIVAVFWFNRDLYGRDAKLGVSGLEGVYYLTAVAALLVGWYFNIVYMREYKDVMGWWHWTTLLFVNPASASGGQDLIFANVVLFPLWTLIDGRRRGMKAAWFYFPMSVVTSFAFAMALYLAVQERQLRKRPELR
ncbi:DUF2834 domain-containing protein [Solimonas sp. K1W22B-7]|uniref:DUF2834 domain-containing protein n=1 Tax=Solimonas sp. K1W22B-7 TaxID=2303331 RepID=UPI0019690F1D|nr:DUF2834 domain-containing protein [Solimonas sp. K1W22B-7]